MEARVLDHTKGLVQPPLAPWSRATEETDRILTATTPVAPLTAVGHDCRAGRDTNRVPELHKHARMAAVVELDRTSPVRPTQPLQSGWSIASN